MWTKLTGFIRSKTDNSDDYNEQYMKFKFNSDDNFSLNKMLELHNMIIVIRSLFLMKALTITFKFSETNICINYE